MEIRPVQPRDINALAEIDGTIESTRYLHLDVGGGEALSASWRLEDRPTRQKLIEPNRLDDDVLFVARQIAAGADEGIALMAEHDGAAVALLVAQERPARKTYHILDLRIDYEHRREGLGTAMALHVVSVARERDVRAVSVETRTNNFPANRLLAKLGFELSGVDARHHSNHDVVKESATLFWYMPLD